MFTFLVIVQIITCIALVIVILLQQGKGAEIGAVFGSSEAIFGSAGPAPFLAKVTAVLATIFMCTSLALTYLSAHQNNGSIMQGLKQPKPISIPAPPPTIPSQKSSTATIPAKTTTKTSAKQKATATTSSKPKQAVTSKQINKIQNKGVTNPIKQQTTTTKKSQSTQNNLSNSTAKTK